MKSEELTIRNILRGVWQFCSYVFIPQWGKKPHEEEVGDEPRKEDETRTSIDKYNDAGQLN